MALILMPSQDMDQVILTATTGQTEFTIPVIHAVAAIVVFITMIIISVMGIIIRATHVVAITASLLRDTVRIKNTTKVTGTTIRVTRAIRPMRTTAVLTPIAVM